MRRSGRPLRLVGTLRGEGVLLWGSRASRPVSYAVDLYREGELQSGNGDVRGDLSGLVGRVVPPGVRLRLQDGVEVEVLLSDVEAEAAAIELRGEMSSLLEESR